jgi:hypothetical protein
MASYTPLTAEQIKAQAETEYKSYYDLLRQSQQQAYQSTDLLLSQQKSGLATAYGKQVEQADKEYNSAYSQAGRQQLSRGMGRSSYALQTLANITQSEAKAKQGIAEAQTAAESNIEAQRSQLASQLAGKLTAYDASQANDILKRINELESMQYDRQYQASRDAASDAQWQAEYNEMVRQFNESLAAQNAARSSGGGGSSSGGSTTVTPPPSGMTYEQMLAALNGYKPNAGKASTPMTHKQASLTAFGTRKQTTGIARGKSTSSSIKNKIMQMTK